MVQYHDEALAMPDSSGDKYLPLGKPKKTVSRPSAANKMRRIRHDSGTVVSSMSICGMRKLSVKVLGMRAT